MISPGPVDYVVHVVDSTARLPVDLVMVIHNTIVVS